MYLAVLIDLPDGRGCGFLSGDRQPLQVATPNSTGVDRRAVTGIFRDT